LADPPKHTNRSSDGDWSGNDIRVAFPFVGDSVGGAQLSALLLAQHLPRARFTPFVILHQQGPLSDHLDRIAVPYELMPLPDYVGRHTAPWRQAWAVLSTVAPIRKFISDHRIDIVHAQDGRMNLTWSLPTRWEGRSFVWHQRARHVRSRIVHLLIHLANMIICNSHFTKTSLPPRVADKAVVLANPFEHKDYLSRHDCRQALIAELGCPPTSRLVGFVGNLTTQKRPDVFLAAAGLIARNHNEEVRFVIAGDERRWTFKQLQQQAISLGLENLVYFLGFRAPIEPVLASFDVLIAPGVDDAFGRTLVEAMLVGTPVMAADSGGHPEIIQNGRTGFLLTPEDPGAFASAAIDLLKGSETWHDVSDSARCFSRDHFSIRTHVDEMVSLYSKLVPDLGELS